MELTISLPHGAQRMAMVGSAERNLKAIRDGLGVSITARAGSLRISGDNRAVDRAAQVLEELAAASRRNQVIEPRQVQDLIRDTGRHGVTDDGRGEGVDEFEVYSRGRRIGAMTEGQQRYIETLGKHDVTFCIGPAGTGKTYLAVAAATAMLKRGQIRKLVLVRPAVEAGERLGFLPGDLQQKVHPYLRPLLDALHDMMDYEQVQRLMACDVIEIVPLAFMRGRTLNDALVILDEAQNTTRSQMLMFLTRLGHGSKMIVNGDTSQIDLEDPRDSGLIDAARRLIRTPGVGFVTLGRTDIVRHSLVQRIVEAYGHGRDEPLGNDAFEPPTSQDR